MNVTAKVFSWNFNVFFNLIVVIIMFWGFFCPTQHFVTLQSVNFHFHVCVDGAAGIIRRVKVKKTNRLCRWEEGWRLDRLVITVRSLIKSWMSSEVTPDRSMGGRSIGSTTGTAVFLLLLLAWVKLPRLIGQVKVFIVLLLHSWLFFLSGCCCGTAFGTPVITPDHQGLTVLAVQSEFCCLVVEGVSLQLWRSASGGVSAQWQHGGCCSSRWVQPGVRQKCPASCWMNISCYISWSQLTVRHHSSPASDWALLIWSETAFT